MKVHMICKVRHRQSLSWLHGLGWAMTECVHDISDKGHRVWGEVGGALLTSSWVCTCIPYTRPPRAQTQRRGGEQRLDVCESVCSGHILTSALMETWWKWSDLSEQRLQQVLRLSQYHVVVFVLSFLQDNIHILCYKRCQFGARCQCYLKCIVMCQNCVGGDIPAVSVCRGFRRGIDCFFFNSSTALRLKLLDSW